MMTDHLDGMHARATAQSSQFGEILDHWVDSYSVALLVLSLPFSMGAEGPLVIVAVTSGVLVYHTQLLVHRESGKFIYPPTGGAASAVLLALSLIAISLVLRVLPPNSHQRHVFVGLILLVMAGGQFTNIRFYLQKLQRERALLGVALLAYGLIAGLYATEHLTLGQISLLWVALSFRMSGSLVLYTVTKRAYRGWDPVLLLLLFALVTGAIALPRASLGNLGLTSFFSCAVAAYCLLSNLREFFRVTQKL